MGVPKFYRWLSERYPLINQMISNSSMLPEIDNFYLDMNGIIHACTHANGTETSVKLSLRDMVLAIFRYIDRCVSGIVKPKKLLYLAIDGVAPRAKLNQQRSRRFRAGQERSESLMKAQQRGEEIDESTMFDSNCITPGTEFMEVIDKHLRYFIRKKIKEDPVWRNLEVIYSGHDVPGEGEHKIMQYIREAREKPNYQPNIRHCLYGQDADLIMLGLATHEPHFTLLREVVEFSSGRNFNSKRDTVMKQTKDVKFQLLHLSVLREYIEVDFAQHHQGDPIDRERLIDDFIFLTFLVGNDFLPHLPTLDISEHAFDVLFDIYRSLQQEKVGYIVGNGEIADFERLEKLFYKIGLQEEEILRNRELEQREFNARRRKNRRGSQEEFASAEEEDQEEFELQAALERAIAESLEESRMGNQMEGLSLNDSKQEEVVTAASAESESCAVAGSAVSNKNYRSRYYFEKFRIIPDPKTEVFVQFIEEISVEYLRGLIWCLAYYLKGCVSWTWYFPYHYGPMLCDMTNLVEKSAQISFVLGQPFLPFQQLLGCLPPSSLSLLPLSYQWLMKSASSPILEYYPIQFDIDMNGKKNPWEAVVLLPFIDSQRLLEAEAMYCAPNTLSPLERQRNSFGNIWQTVFDPANLETVPSCNPAIGLMDITKCQTKVTEVAFDLHPSSPFAAQLIPGTVKTCAGFPSLGVLAISGAALEAVKLNVFGSESRYKSIIFTITQRFFSADDIQLSLLLNRSVFVNYPLIHEAKVVGVSCATKSCKLKTRRVGKEEIQEIEETIHSDSERTQWLKDAENEESRYLKGRGLPGTGGIVIGNVIIRLLVIPLQGMKTDRVTGIRKKVFGETVADIPIQMALWTSPVADARFEERDEVLSVEAMFPYGSTVIATEGPFKGVMGTVIGPHRPLQKSTESRSRLGEDLKTSSPQQGPRVVDVEFTMYPPEPPFGYALNVSVKEEYFSSREVSRRLGLSTSNLGLICGSLFLDPPRVDVGLNLKKNGEYQLLEYARGIVMSPPSSSLPQPGVPGNSAKNCWNSGDTVRIIGSTSPSDSSAGGGESFQSSSGQVVWEYSEKTIELIQDYMTAFPLLFSRLQSLPNQRKYSALDLFGLSGAQAEAELDRLMTWMKAQPFYLQPRSPLTTTSMSKVAIHAVERAVDVRVSHFTTEEGQSQIQKVIKKNVPVGVLFRDQLFSPYDTPLTSINSDPPELGDRVMNLIATGVPFGLKGTVITIHSGTGYVEVLFDEEFSAGKSLQGNCSQFRGALVSWSSVLKCSTNPLNPSNRSQPAGNRQMQTSSAYGSGSSTSSGPPKLAKKKQTDSTAPQSQQAAEVKAIPAAITAPQMPIPDAGVNPSMKKVTSILRRDMVARQNPNAASPQQQPQPQPMETKPAAPPVAVPPVAVPPVVAQMVATAPPSPPVSVESKVDKSQSDNPLPAPPFPKPAEKVQSSSVAEKLLKARSAMKEKLNKPPSQAASASAPSLSSSPASGKRDQTSSLSPPEPQPVMPSPSSAPPTASSAQVSPNSNASATTKPSTLSPPSSSEPPEKPKKQPSLLVPSRVARKIVPKESTGK